MSRKAVTKLINGIIHKSCTGCNKFKTLDEYHINTNYPLGRQAWCKECVSKYSKNRNTKDKNRIATIEKYGITKEQYDKLYNFYNGKCPICLEKFDLLNIDHDHNTNRVRGLLCINCNKGLGLFKDNIEYLRRAIIYLENE